MYSLLIFFHSWILFILVKCNLEIFSWKKIKKKTGPLSNFSPIQTVSNSECGKLIWRHSWLVGATQHLWLGLDLSQTNRRLWGSTITRQTSLPHFLFSLFHTHTEADTHTYCMSSQCGTCISLHYYVDISSHLDVPVCVSCSAWDHMFWVSDLVRHDTSWFYKRVSIPGLQY